MVARRYTEREEEVKKGTNKGDKKGIIKRKRK